MNKNDELKKTLSQYQIKKRLYERRLDNDIKKMSKVEYFPKFMGYAFYESITDKNLYISLSFEDTKIKLKKNLSDIIGKTPDGIEIVSLEHTIYKKAFLQILNREYKFKFSSKCMVGKDIFEEIEHLFFILNENSEVYIVEPMYEKNIFYGVTSLIKTELKEAIKIDPVKDLPLIDYSEKIINNLRICRSTSIKDFKKPLYIFKENRWLKRY